MAVIRVTFTRHVHRLTCKYKCTMCGKRWQVSANTEWTENPFNKDWMAGRLDLLDRKCREELKKKLEVSPCPECLIPNAPTKPGSYRQSRR